MSNPSHASAFMASLPADLVATAARCSLFSQWLTLLRAAGLTPTLKGDKPFTVFAPTDQAFARLGPPLLRELLKPDNQDRLIEMLCQHIVAGKLMAHHVSGRMTEIRSLQGAYLVLSGVDGLWVNQARMVRVDLEASNGVLHAIDRPLAMPELMSQESR